LADKRTAVKVGLTAAENAHITRQAQTLGMDRSTLMRLRALGDPSTGVGAAAAPITLQTYQRAVQAALAASRGCAPRPIIEAIAAAVINAVHVKPQTPTSNTARAAHTDG
jgi:cobalamin synthase